MEKKNYIVAIDLGSSNVVVMIGSKGEGGKVHIDDVAVKEVEGMMRGEIKNIELVARSIKEAVTELEERLSIRIAEAYTGISGQHIKCAKHSYYVFVGRDGEINREDVEKLNESMRNVHAPEGEKILHIIPQNYIIDDKEEVADPVGMFGRKLEATFNFVLGENVHLSRLENALTRMGIRQAQMYINPLVSSEAVVLPDERELGVAVVDIGAGTSDVTIYYDKIVRHVGVVPLGADAINRDIRAQGILERYVEDLKIKYGGAIAENAAEKVIKVPGRTPREPKEISFYTLAATIEARLQDIFDFVMKEIRQAGYENKLAAGMVLTGGCAQLQDIDRMAKNYTGLDVRIASPEASVDEESFVVAEDTRFSAAVGILKKGLENNRTSTVEPVRRISTPGAGQAAAAPGLNKTQPVADPPEVPDGDDPPKLPRKNPFSKLIGGIKDIFEGTMVDDDTDTKI